MSQVDLEKFAERLGDNLFNDLKKDLKVIIPRWLETMLEQRLKGIPQTLDAVENIERENKLIGKDVETNNLLQQKQQAELVELKIKYIELDKKLDKKFDEFAKIVTKAISKDNKDLAKAMAESFETISERKPKSLWKFWKRGTK